MDRQGFAGMRLEFSGWLKQRWGQLTGDQAQEAAGRRDQAVGRAQQAGVIEQEASARQLKEFQHQHRHWNF